MFDIAKQLGNEVSVWLKLSAYNLSLKGIITETQGRNGGVRIEADPLRNAVTKVALTDFSALSFFYNTRLRFYSTILGTLGSNHQENTPQSFLQANLMEIFSKLRFFHSWPYQCQEENWDCQQDKQIDHLLNTNIFFLVYPKDIILCYSIKHIITLKVPVFKKFKHFKN